MQRLSPWGHEQPEARAIHGCDNTDGVSTSQPEGCSHHDEPVGRLWSDGSRESGQVDRYVQANIAPDQGVLVELTGFELVTPSLRKMQSKPCDQGKRGVLAGLWGGCGTSVVRGGERP